MCKVNTGIVKVYILVMQECTTLHCKNVHSCYIKVYTLIMQGATLNLKFIMLVDVNYNIQ